MIEEMIPKLREFIDRINSNTYQIPQYKLGYFSLKTKKNNYTN